MFACPIRATLGLAGVLLLVRTGMAQPLGPANSDTCDLTTLQSRIDIFNAECCTTPPCFEGGACSLDCAAVLLPLNNECGAFLGALYDDDDGTRGKQPVP